MHIAFVDSSTVGLNALLAAKRAGHFVTFISSRQFADFIGGVATVRDDRYTDRVIEIETALDKEELFSTLSAVHCHQPLDAVVSVMDFCTYQVASCAKRLGLPGTDPAAVIVAQDKAACRVKIEADGIASLPSEIVTDLAGAIAFADRVGYPVIAKPNRGAGSLRVGKAICAEDLDAYFATLDRDLSVPPGVVQTLSAEIVMERYVDGPLFSVEIAVADGEVRPLMLSWRKRCIVDPAIELGTTMPAPVSAAAAQALIDYARAVVASVGLDLGVFHIELIYGPDGPVLVEVNPRIMGGNITTVFKLATDVDPYDIWLDIHLHGRLPESCRNVAPVRAASTRNIGPVRPGTVAVALPSDWDAPFRDHIRNWNVEIEAGKHVDAMESTFCPNHFQLVRNSPVESSLIAEWVIAVTAGATGLDLRQSSEDYLLL